MSGQALPSCTPKSGLTAEGAYCGRRPQSHSTWPPPTLGTQHIPHSPRLGGFSIFISKAWIASISRSWQNQDTCKIPYNTLDSQKVPKSTVKLTLPLQEMYDTNNIKLKGEKKGDTGFLRYSLLFTTRVHRSRLQSGSGKQTLQSGFG